MGVREQMQKNKGLAIGIAALLIVVAGIYIVSQIHGDNKRAAAEGTTYGLFTDDDGKTLFADDVLKEVPFDHNGKQAVKAYCFTTDGGKTHTVGYLERYNAAGKKALDAYKPRKAEDQDPMDLSRLVGKAKEVKLPGAAGVGMDDFGHEEVQRDCYCEVGKRAAICANLG